MPSWKAVTCLPSFSDDRVLADEVDARDVAVEVDPDAGPVQPGGDLLDMGRLAGAVIARDHDAAVAGEARQDRQGGLPVEEVVRVEVGHMLVGLREGRDPEVEVDAEGLADGDGPVGERGGRDVREHKDLVGAGVAVRARTLAGCVSGGTPLRVSAMRRSDCPSNGRRRRAPSRGTREARPCI